MMLLFGALAFILWGVSTLTKEKISKNLTNVLNYIALVLAIVGFIGVVPLMLIPKESFVVDIDYIPIHNVQDLTVTCCNDVYVFEDGYGNLFAIPKERANINTFPDEELQITSISKVIIGEHYPDSVIFWLDFGLLKIKEPIYTYREEFGFFIPESSLKFSPENNYKIISELTQEGSEGEEVK